LSGGIALLAWSSGVTTVLSFLGNPSVIQEDTQVQLTKCLRKIIFYDATAYSFGYDIPKGGYIPTDDPDLKTPEEIGSAFTLWVSAYWNHPDIASRSISGLQRNDKLGDKPSIAGMTPEQVQSTMDVPASVRADLPTHSPASQSTLREQTHRALYDEILAQQFLPDVSVTYFVCTSTPWVSMWTYFAAEKEYEDFKSRSLRGRSMRFLEVVGGNHFLQWDNPELMLEVVIRELGL